MTRVSIAKVLKEYSDIVIGMKEGYTEKELTVEIIRADHPELNFMDDEEIIDLIKSANETR